MTQRRRIVFQLTPLLDVLLIVIFAQYLLIAGTSAQESERFTAEIDAARNDESEAEQFALTLQHELAEKATLLIEKNSEIATLVKRLEDIEGQRRIREEQAIRHLEWIAETVREMLNIDESTARRALAPLPPESRAALKAELEQLRGKQAGEILRFLRNSRMIRNHIDIWELNVAADNGLTLRIGEESFGPLFDKGKSAIANWIFKSQSRLPQPKDTVILLFSYGDAHRLVVDTALDGVSLAAEALASKFPGKSFRISDLGFIPVLSSPVHNDSSDGQEP